jgi:hypothetical protein
MIAGIIGAIISLIVNAANSTVARVINFTDPKTHGGWGLILGLVGLIGALIAIPFPEVAAILMLVAGIGMFFIVPWGLALFGSILLFIGAILAYLDRSSKRSASA